MKKILLLGLFTIAVLFGACEKLDPITVIVTPTAAVDSTLPVVGKTITFSVQHTGANPAVIQWERRGIMEPTGFTYMVNGNATGWGKETLEPNETWDFTLVVNPNGNTGTATGNIVFFDLADPNNTEQVFEYSVTTETSLFEIMPIGSMNSSANAALETDYYIDVINSSLSPVTVTWVQDTTGLNNTQGWTTAVSIEGQIPNSQAVKTGTLYVPQQDTIQVEVKFDPNGNVGNGRVNVFFYIPADSAASRRNQLVRHTGTI